MDGYHYVYTLESLSRSNQIYTGQTQDLKQRLRAHNSGGVPHTSKFTPWHIRSTTAFKSKDRALAFERYLKSGSGRPYGAPISDPARSRLYFTPSRVGDRRSGGSVKRRHSNQSLEDKA